MTDLNTYLQQIKSRLQALEIEYSNLEQKEAGAKKEHLEEIEKILKQIQIEYSKYELDETPVYPIALENLKIMDNDIEEALNKLFKFGPMPIRNSSKTLIVIAWTPLRA